MARMCAHLQMHILGGVKNRLAKHFISQGGDKLPGFIRPPGRESEMMKFEKGIVHGSGR
jgi:hypothetical protein